MLSPVHGSDGSMFDFEELEAKSPSEDSGNDAFEFRGEDAHERFKIAELRIVQETVRKIEGDEDSDGDCPGGEFSDTEDENSTNARYVPVWVLQRNNRRTRNCVFDHLMFVGLFPD